MTDGRPMTLDERGLVVRPPPRPIPGGPATVAEVLDAGVTTHPDKEALVGASSRFTYAETDQAADQAAGALWGLGVRPGDRVAMCLPNVPDLAIAFLATMRIGAIWVGVSRQLAPAEMRYLLMDSGASLLLTAAPAALALADLGTTRVVELAAWHERLARTEPLGRQTIDPHAPAAIAYTSGTTGRPKGAVHSQHNMLWAGAITRETDPAPPDERQGVILPMTLLNLQVLGPITSWIRGATCVCIDRIDPVGLAAWIRRERVTRMIAVPTILHDLLTDPNVEDASLATLTRLECGAAATPQSFRELYRRRFGHEVLTGYGLTEAPGAVCREMPDHARTPGCSGRARACLEVVILDDDRTERPPGVEGEIAVRARREGPWADVYTPMLGYWNRPEATAHALRGGVLHTDDLGYLDNHGNVFVTARRSEVINRGGANVYPAEVERVLMADDRLAACAVFGIPDERLGERVLAAVEVVVGSEVDEQELLDRCRAELARYKVPERIEILEQLPRTPIGKVKKADLVMRFTPPSSSEGTLRP